MEPGELRGVATVGRHEPDIGISGALADERDPLGRGDAIA
jgi:hypothetical protein